MSQSPDSATELSSDSSDLYYANPDDSDDQEYPNQLHFYAKFGWPPGYEGCNTKIPYSERFKPRNAHTRDQPEARAHVSQFLMKLKYWTWNTNS